MRLVYDRRPSPERPPAAAASDNANARSADGSDTAGPTPRAQNVSIFIRPGWLCCLRAGIARLAPAGRAPSPSGHPRRQSRRHHRLHLPRRVPERRPRGGAGDLHASNSGGHVPRRLGLEPRRATASRAPPRAAALPRPPLHPEQRLERDPERPRPLLPRCLRATSPRTTTRDLAPRSATSTAGRSRSPPSPMRCATGTTSACSRAPACVADASGQWLLGDGSFVTAGAGLLLLQPAPDTGIERPPVMPMAMRAGVRAPAPGGSTSAIPRPRRRAQRSSPTRWPPEVGRRRVAWRF